MSAASSTDFSHDAMFVIATSPVGIVMNMYSFYVFSYMNAKGLVVCVSPLDSHFMPLNDFSSVPSTPYY
uniref:WS_DGAT_C domain-containing protein n=1 Tax=Panagrellus redivivus TaxID=6233 RepID=A0A7E4ZSC9_PANRE